MFNMTTFLNKPRLTPKEAVDEFSSKIYKKDGQYNLRTIKQIVAIFGFSSECSRHDNGNLHILIHSGPYIVLDKEDYLIWQTFSTVSGNNPMDELTNREEVKSLYLRLDNQYETWRQRMENSLIPPQGNHQNPESQAFYEYR